METKFKIILGTLLLLFSGCSSAIMVDDGVVRDEAGTPLNTVYGDIHTSSHEQHAIFDGRSYFLSGHLSLNNGASAYFVGCTQNKTTHFETFSVQFSSSPVDVHFYESPNITSLGTQFYGYNSERNINTAHDMLLYTNSTISSLGTQLFHVSAYGGNNIEGDTVIENELVLKINTCYVFEIYNGDGNTNAMTYQFIWHESEFNRNYYY